MDEQKVILSVSELNRCARSLLEEAFHQVWIEGEISNLSQPSSGHCYFTLKDANAQVRCAIFRSQLQRLKFKLENG
ncbi:MAG TPA: exodeoxyribonuclease VII large subunit, partial [Coxiellaceae bacterium]|nr:exodeoxyribonuclease VII large subunit [Coxiellaceae bacterium]